MKKLLYILLSLMTLSLVSCEREDDINDIFNGKKWYIKDFVANGNKATNEDMKPLYYSGSDCYVITFTGNSFMATMSKGATITGTWNANGKKQTLSLWVNNAQGVSSTLDNTLVEIIKNVSSYEGDANILTIKKDNGNLIRLSVER